MRRLLFPVAFVIFAICAASAQAHTEAATTVCSTSSGNSITYNWTSFASSGTANGSVNTPSWTIVYTPTGGTATTTTGSVSFPGSSYSATIAIAGSAGTAVASSAWTSSQTRDGNANSVSTNLTIANCLASPAISTTASSGVLVGGQIGDQAVLSAGRAPTGTITFRLYSASDTTCSTVLATAATTVSGDGGYASPVLSEATAGNYQWTASYSGDANNSPVTDPCGQVAEQVTVTTPPPPTPTPTPTPTTSTPTAPTPLPVGSPPLAPSLVSPAIVTTASRGVTVGGTIRDTAVLTGGSSPTGEITFRLYKSSDVTCAVSLLSRSTTVKGNGSYASPAVTENRVGGYQWTASYSGDANNSAAADSCNATGERVTVGARAVKAVCVSSPVRLTGVIGKVRNTFTAHLTSLGVKSVTFYLDGRRLETLRTPRNGRFSVTIDARAMSYGAHRLVATATMKSSSCADVNRAGTFVHVRPAAVVPVFTG